MSWDWSSLTGVGIGLQALRGMQTPTGNAADFETGSAVDIETGSAVDIEAGSAVDIETGSAADTYRPCHGR
ncbi:hypothetical protein [Corynebacterium auriscanis]|uniref:hypothetical protein n=1 Tax=Corynebacterium auriscanis TaxID=99807 RepID=UPI0024AE2109|nr:hypothetical protein [Corynebacterium auriscanis]